MNFTIKVVVAALFSAAAIASAETLATVNGTVIDSEEVQKVVMEGTQGAFPNLPKEKQDQLLNNIVEGMIMQELIYENAKKKGLLQTPDYRQELADMVKRLERQLAARVWEKDIFNNIQISEEDVRRHYRANLKEYDVPQTVHARNILLPSEGEAQRVIDELKGLRGQALQKRFSELAVKKSTGPTAAKGGDLGRFPRGQMVPEFDAAVFSLKEGTITTSPVKTPFGYHVIYLEKRFVPKKYSFEEVRGFIEKQLKANKFKAEIDRQSKALQKSAEISYGN
jgi:parvulin-like peptidyl-prolyl isomerase